MGRTYTVTTTVYQYAELDDKAKGKARHWYRSCEDCYCWGDESVASLKAFADWFGVKIRDYSLGGSDNWNNHVKWELDRFDQWFELEDVRLWKYLNNNPHHLPKLDGSCPFTGYCMDETLLDPIREFMKRPTINECMTIEKLIGEGIDKFVSAYCADVDYSYSDEAVAENIELNEYEFTKEGNRYL